MYRDGRGVLQSDTEAVKWYRKAAEQGDADAQNNLGVTGSLSLAPGCVIEGADIESLIVRFGQAA